MKLKEIVSFLIVPMAVLLYAGTFFDALSNLIDWIPLYFSISLTFILVIGVFLFKKGVFKSITIPIDYYKNLKGFIIGLMITVWLPQPFRLMASNNNANITTTESGCGKTFDDLKRLNILIFPFQGFDSCNSNLPCDNAFQNGLSKLSPVDVEVILCDDEEIIRSSKSVVDSIITATNADIIIWGEYEKPRCDFDTTKIFMNYRLSKKYRKGWILENESSEFISTMMDISTGRVLGDINEIVNWILAFEEVNKGNIENGIKYLENINFRPDHDLEAYLLLLETKAVLSVKSGNLDDAVKINLERLQLKPRSPYANLMMSNIYYNANNIDSAYYYAINAANYFGDELNSIGFYRYIIDLGKSKKDWNTVSYYALKFYNETKSYEALEYISTSCYKNGNYECTLEFSEIILSMDENNNSVNDILIMAGDAAYRINKFEKSYNLLKKVKNPAREVIFNLRKLESYKRFLRGTKYSLSNLEEIYTSKSLDTIILTVDSDKLVFVDSNFKDDNNQFKLFKLVEN